MVIIFFIGCFTFKLILIFAKNNNIFIPHEQTVFFLLFPIILFAQKKSNSEFIGSLQTAEKNIITYKITYKELADGKIEGTSVTDFWGSDNTTAKIIGSYSKDRKKISFRETENIVTKSNSDISEFCFINVENAKLKSINGKNIINGSFTGKFINGGKCAQGLVYLIGVDLLNQLYDTLIKSEIVIKNDSLKKTALKANKLLQESNENKLLADETLKLNWRSEDIIVEVWDALKEDKDVISIFINDKIVVKDYLVKLEKKAFAFPFIGNNCIIKILSVSDGEIPPNTVNFSLIDGAQKTPVVTSLEKGKTSQFKLERVK